MTPISTAHSSVPSFGLSDVLASVGITAWYALPDYIGSRTTRGAVKAGILAASAAYGLRAARHSSAGNPLSTSPDESAVEPEDTDPAGPAFLPRPVVLGLVAVAVLSVVGITAAITVGMERLVYRYGERLSQRGVQLPHTRIGMVAGVLSAALTLVDNAAHNGQKYAAP